MKRIDHKEKCKGSQDHSKHKKKIHRHHFDRYKGDASKSLSMPSCSNKLLEKSHSPRKHEKHRRTVYSASDHLNMHQYKRDDHLHSKNENIDDDDAPFSWESYRTTFNKMFFTEHDFIKRFKKLCTQVKDSILGQSVEFKKNFDELNLRMQQQCTRGTKEYNEFWTFLKKYQIIQQKAALKTSVEREFNTDLEKKVPELRSKKDFHHKRSKINFTMVTGDIYDLLIRGHVFKDDERSPITQERVQEFQYILLLYIDFLQKEKFARLQKLRKDQKNLPISNFQKEIINSVKNHQVVVVAGDTGCGKSTQVPQYLLNSGFDSIACTQPRRIACISLCKRVSYETLNEYGLEVGYQIRFDKSKNSHTKILFLTEGLLLRQVSTDPMLSTYKVIILDEVHERHLPCDFLLGIMKCLTLQRPDVKIILMSATINIELFTEYFNNCPVIQVPGRLFPIQIHYYPVPVIEQRTQSGKLNPAPYIRVLNLIDQKYPSNERGDVLIFLSGMTEISIVEEATKLYAEQNKNWIILPLHSTLSIDEQDKVFDIAPETVRKCIISTNIAETSITIDGVRFVVDSGKVKEMSYDPNCHMQRLQEFWISKASAEQRKGRAGRTGPGVCFRLYSQEEYDSLAAYSKPEIQRVPLDSLLLQMLSMGLPDARKFPFLEPPPMKSIEESLQSLKDQGALTDEETMTPLGQMLSHLPVEVTIGKMLIHGSVFSLMEPMLSLAAALSVQSPFTNQSFRNPDILAARQQLESDHGDPFTLLFAYQKWLQVKSEQGSGSRKWCKRHGLEEQRFYEMTKLRKQFKELLKDAGLFIDKETFTSSYDRTERYGELKHLRDMKRQFHRAPRKRKILKSCAEGFAEAESDDDERIDIRDVEFRMSHNRKEVHHLSSASQVTSHRDIVCLKLIVCSGLYPRSAIADEHNSFKSDSEQYFHTKEKPFVVLHPNGILALQPDLVQLKEMNIEKRKNFSSRTPLSTKHQMISYMSLLETTKPYLVNCLRIPAAHMLFLLSHTIDTNQDFTRLVCDSWLELRFPDPDVAQEFVSKAWVIRDLWQKLLHRAFLEISASGEEKSPEIKRMAQKLHSSIIEYFQMEVLYSFSRLLAADIKNIYIGPQEDNVSVSIQVLAEADSCQQHPVKGGLQVKEYLTYNCLMDSEDKHLQYIQKHWICPNCQQEMVATVLDQIRHKEHCQPDDEKDQQNATGSGINPLKKAYFCPECQEELYLTVTETLRHKRKHLLPEHT